MANPEQLRHNQEHESYSMQEVKDRFGSKWILGQVTEYDDYNRVSHIRVITASRSRKKISKVLAKLPSSSKQDPPEEPYYIFHTNPMSGLRFRLLKRNLGL